MRRARGPARNGLRVGQQPFSHTGGAPRAAAARDHGASLWSGPRSEPLGPGRRRLRRADIWKTSGCSDHPTEIQQASGKARGVRLAYLGRAPTIRCLRRGVVPELNGIGSKPQNKPPGSDPPEGPVSNPVSLQSVSNERAMCFQHMALSNKSWLPERQRVLSPSYPASETAQSTQRDREQK